MIQKAEQPFPRSLRVQRAAFASPQFRGCMEPNSLCTSDNLAVPRISNEARMIPVLSRRRPSQLSSTISSLITAADAGDSGATDALFTALYAELHRMARRELARQGAPPSLSVTTLLHEAYIDISARDGVVFPDRARFMGYAARVMRGYIIDHARSRGAVKRGGEFQLTSAEGHDLVTPADPKELSDISDALDQLAKVEPELAELVDLKFFCGFSFAEIAALRNVSERTVQRQWEKARIYLHQSLSPGLSDGK